MAFPLQSVSPFPSSPVVLEVSEPLSEGPGVSIQARQILKRKLCPQKMDNGRGVLAGDIPVNKDVASDVGRFGEFQLLKPTANKW